MSITPVQKDSPAEKVKTPSTHSPSIVNGNVDLAELDHPSRVKRAFLGSNSQHVFSDPSALAYWTDIYERVKYEGRHRFDPDLQWTPSEERRLLRKVLPAFSCHVLLLIFTSSLIFALCSGSGPCSPVLTSLEETSTALFRISW